MGVRINDRLSNVTEDGSKISFGFGAGWVAEYNFNSNLYLSSGIGFENIAHIGVEFNKFQVRAGANYGILEATGDGGYNLSINVGLAYMF